VHALAAAALAAATLVWSDTPPVTVVVERFIQMDVSDMTPSFIESMMAVEEKDVPAKLRKRFRAKKFELYTYRQLGEGNRKGTVRIPDKDCAVAGEVKSQDIEMLLSVGFVEILENEVDYLKKNTRCSERKMMCEFTLQIVLEREKKRKELKKRFFLHAKDPLMALVSEYRTKGANHDTPFFGRSPFPVCGGD
jgi:hypothetical protein